MEATLNQNEIKMIPNDNIWEIVVFFGTRYGVRPDMDVALGNVHKSWERVGDRNRSSTGQMSFQ